MKSKRNGLLVLAAVLLIAVVGAVGCAPQAPAPAPKPPAAPTPAPQPTATVAAPATKPPAAAKLEAVKVGDLGYASDFPSYIAVDKGYFREQGIEIQFERFRSGVDMIAPLSTGELHAGNGAYNAGLFNAAARGVALKVVATTSRPIPGSDANFWMVRPDLKDQIKSFADFKGRTVNLLSPANIVYYALGETLKKYGLTLKDMNLVNMGPADTGPAFQNKAIDISIVVEPNAALFEEQRVAVKWKEMTAETGPLEVATLIYSEKWAKENPDLAKRFAVAQLKGQLDFIRAAQKGPNRAEVVNIGVKYTPLKDPALYEKMAWTGMSPDGSVNKDQVKKMNDWFFENGYQERKANIDTLVDTSYLEYASKVLSESKR